MTVLPAIAPHWKRRLTWGALGIAAVFAAVYVAAWFAMASVLRTQLDAWIGGQARSGRLVNHGPPVLSGFPARVTLTVPNWEMVSPVTAGEWRWRTAEVRLWATPWNPKQFTVDLAGTHDVGGVWTPLGINTMVTATQADLRLTLTLDGRIAQFETAFSGLSVTTGPADALMALTSGQLSVTRQDAPERAMSMWRIGAAINNLRVPSLAMLGADSLRAITARLTADLEGPVGSGPLPTVLDAWRQSGGTLEVRELSFDWPPLSMNGSGTFALDDRLQPIGAMTATFRGFFETVDVLKERGAVPPTEANIVRTALSLFARTPAGGTQPELNFSVTVQNQKLYTGPVTLMMLPSVVWPSGVIIP